MLWFYECESLVMLGFMKCQVFGNTDRERKSRCERKGVEEQRKICLCVCMLGLVEQNLALFFIPKRFFFYVSSNNFFLIPIEKRTFFNCDYHVSEKQNKKMVVITYFSMRKVQQKLQ